MLTRFKLRRYEVLATRSLTLADAAQLMVDELMRLARDHQSPHLILITEAYRGAIADVQRGVRLGLDLPPLLFQLEAVGRDIAAELNGLRQALLDEAEEAPPDATPALATSKF